jgi:hypothetical protein
MVDLIYYCLNIKKKKKISSWVFISQIMFLLLFRFAFELSSQPSHIKVNLLIILNFFSTKKTLAIIECFFNVKNNRSNP